MSKEFIDLELIEQYCNNQLEGEQLTAFEQRLQKDTPLLQEVKLFQDMLKGITLQGDENLKRSIAVAHQELVADDFFEDTTKTTKNPPKRMPNIRRILAIAASLTIFVLAGLFLFNKNSKIDNVQASTQLSKQNILDNYGEKVATDKTLNLINSIQSYGFVATDKGKRDSLARALENYNIREYENARALLVDYLTRYPDDQIAMYYLGLSFFELGDYSKALRNLQPLSIDLDFGEQQGAEWYTALTYLLLETDSGKVSAKQLVEKISKDTSSPYQQDADGMLKRFKGVGNK